MDLKQLEFFQVLIQIEKYAKTLEGKKHIQTITPLTTEIEALESMAEIKTAKAFIEENKTPFFGEYINVSKILKDIKIKRILSVLDLLQIYQFLKGIHHLKRTLTLPLEKESKEALIPLIEALIDLKSLRLSMSQMFDEDGLKNDATPSLKTLNHQKNVAERRLQEKLKNLVDRHQDQLSESFFTERFNRYVVPVKLSYKNKFKGSVVDYSASGETVYMEPYDVGELTVNIRQIENNIAEEIKKILKELSEALHDNIEALQINYEMATRLDVIFAKAQYATSIGAMPIRFGNTLDLIEARHPLIPIDDVIANDIVLNETEKVMIISGSNTGGKTVVLKTVGLLSLMALSGLLIPASNQSVIPFYKTVYADIGDEQSIEQSLSTFSSHMTHIIGMIENIKPKTLFLLDEIGGGTDPKAGAALARALLDELKDKDVHVFVTTHYSELKAYAYQHESVVNASVAFNKETLKPTYHLYTHTPGESHAFLIAKRLGLSPSILNHAESYLKNEQDPISDLVLQLEASKNALEEERNELGALIKESQSLKIESENKIIEYQEKKQALTDTFNQKLSQEKKRLASLFEEKIDSLKTSQVLKPHEINEARNALFKSNEDDHPVSQPHDFKAGDSVLILKYNRPGTLIKRLSNQTWLVEMGTLETKLSESAFSYIETPKKKKDKPVIKSQTFKKHVSFECDLRGLRVLEAKETLQKYLDDCLIAKVPFARIIHGFGTLAVRNMVKELLKDHPLVSSHRDGGNNEGGQGVTVVYF